MPSVDSVVLNDYSIVVNFAKAAAATFTITLNAGNIRFVAYVPDMLEAAGGWIVVTAVSHEFEIYTAQSASETFNVQSAKVIAVTVTVAPIYTTKHSASETFNVGSAEIMSISAEVKDARETVTADNTETFVCSTAVITRLTASVEGVGVIPV